MLELLDLKDKLNVVRFNTIFRGELFVFLWRVDFSYYLINFRTSCYITISNYGVSFHNHLENSSDKL